MLSFLVPLVMQLKMVTSTMFSNSVDSIASGLKFREQEVVLFVKC